MSEFKHLISQGFYARKQLYIKDSLISWSHRRRFETGLRLVRQSRPRRLLDYGCGDGTFLAMLRETEHDLEAVGCEPLEQDVENLKQRLDAISNLSFCTVDAMEDPVHNGRYDMITCMEVLEHVVEAGVVFNRLHRLLSKDGRLVISVPVEIGLPLLVKQTARRIAGWRGLGDYRSVARYKWPELLASMAPGSRQHMPRPVYQHPDGNLFHDHKGFNWRVLLRDLQSLYRTEQILYSPLSWVPAMASQVWFILTPR